jgi:cell division protein FtsB
MGFFKTKTDPISQRSRELTARIAELESRIKHLSQKAEPADPRRIRSTAYPPGASGVEPVFEPVDPKPLKDLAEPPATARHYNDLGARKFDLVAVLERIKRYFHGPPAANPRLVTYLAAGNIQGLRPLRYEKRVARNRFVALTLVLVVVLFGLFCFLARRR